MKQLISAAAAIILASGAANAQTMTEKAYRPKIQGYTVYLLDRLKDMPDGYGHSVYNEAPDYKDRMFRFFNEELPTYSDNR